MNIKQAKPTVFSTDNFSLAAYLKTQKCKLLHITKKNPKRSFFNFEESPLRQQLTKEFWEESGLTEPRAFCRNQRELKTILYDNSYPTKP